MLCLVCLLDQTFAPDQYHPRSPESAAVPVFPVLPRLREFENTFPALLCGRLQYMYGCTNARAEAH